MKTRLPISFVSMIVIATTADAAAKVGEGPNCRFCLVPDPIVIRHWITTFSAVRGSSEFVRTSSWQLPAVAKVGERPNCHFLPCSECHTPWHCHLCERLLKVSENLVATFDCCLKNYKVIIAEFIWVGGRAYQFHFYHWSLMPPQAMSLKSEKDQNCLLCLVPDRTVFYPPFRIINDLNFKDVAVIQNVFSTICNRIIIVKILVPPSRRVHHVLFGSTLVVGSTLTVGSFFFTSMAFLLCPRKSSPADSDCFGCRRPHLFGARPLQVHLGSGILLFHFYGLFIIAYFRRRPTQRCLAGPDCFGCRRPHPIGDRRVGVHHVLFGSTLVLPPLPSFPGPDFFLGVA